MKHALVCMLLLLTLGCVPDEASQPVLEVPADEILCDMDMVVIQADHHTEGVRAEYAWLDKHHPGYQFIRQSLMDCNGTPVDVMVIRTREGQPLVVFFDISSFFGKF